MRRAPSNTINRNKPKQDGPIAIATTTAVAVAVAPPPQASISNTNNNDDVVVAPSNNHRASPPMTTTTTTVDNSVGTGANKDAIVNDPPQSNNKSNNNKNTSNDKARDKDDAIALLGLAASAPRPAPSSNNSTVAAGAPITAANVKAATQQQKKQSVTVVRHVTLPPTITTAAAAQQQQVPQPGVVLGLARGAGGGGGRHAVPTRHTARTPPSAGNTATNHPQQQQQHRSSNSANKSVNIRRHHSTPATTSNNTPSNTSRYNVAQAAAAVHHYHNAHSVQQQQQQQQQHRHSQHHPHPHHPHHQQHQQQQHYAAAQAGIAPGAQQYLMAGGGGGNGGASTAVGRRDSFYIESLHKQTGGKSSFKYPIDYAVGVAIRKHVLLPILNNNNGNKQHALRDESLCVQHMKSLFRGEGLWINQIVNNTASVDGRSMGEAADGSGGGTGGDDSGAPREGNMMQRLITEAKARKNRSTHAQDNGGGGGDITTTTSVGADKGMKRFVTYNSEEEKDGINHNNKNKSSTVQKPKPNITKRLIQARLCRATSQPDTTFFLHNWYHYNGDKFLTNTSAVWSEWWERKARIQDFGCEMLKIECIPQVAGAGSSMSGELLGVAYVERSVTDLNGAGRVTLLRGMRINPNSNKEVYRRSALSVAVSGQDDDFLPKYEGVADMLFRAIVLRSLMYGTMGLIVNCPKNEADEQFYAKHMGHAIRFTKDGRKVFCLLGADRWPIVATEFNRHLTRGRAGDPAASVTAQGTTDAAVPASNSNVAVGQAEQNGAKQNSAPPVAVIPDVKVEKKEDEDVVMEDQKGDKGEVKRDAELLESESESERKRQKMCADVHV